MVSLPPPILESRLINEEYNYGREKFYDGTLRGTLIKVICLLQINNLALHRNDRFFFRTKQHFWS